jgi:hypothetical protein
VVIDLSVFVTSSFDVTQNGDVVCDVFCILVKAALIYIHTPNKILRCSVYRQKQRVSLKCKLRALRS